eukprot:scaffold50326_cov60-Phaeocystis_antarctica.AAC.3
MAAGAAARAARAARAAGKAHWVARAATKVVAATVAAAMARAAVAMEGSVATAEAASTVKVRKAAREAACRPRPRAPAATAAGRHRRGLTHGVRVVYIQPVHDDCLRGVATVLVGLAEGVAGCRRCFCEPPVAREAGVDDHAVLRRAPVLCAALPRRQWLWRRVAN